MAFLPAEILAEIFNGAHRSYLLIDTWLTGDKILHSKLLSVITHVDLRLCSGAKFALPHLLSSFRSLRYLSLESMHLGLENPSSWHSSLKSLSPTLETLCIKSGDAQVAFLQRPQNPSSDARLCNYGRDPTTWIDLGSNFPSLTRLELHNLFSSKSYLLPPLDDYYIAGLPATLKVFQSSPSIIMCSNSLPRLLPKSLERLEALILWAPPDVADDRLLPPHLSYVGQFAPMDDNFLPFLQSLPNIETGLIQFDSWTVDLIGHLPTYVNSIEITNTDSSTFTRQNSDWISPVPRSVKSLKIALSPSGASIIPSTISQLPQHLTKLDIFGEFDIFTLLRDACDEGVDVSSFWPKTLQTFIAGSLCTPRDLKLLPRTLTSLHMTFDLNESTVQLNAAHFPPLLVECTFSDISFAIIGGHLPSSLKMLGKLHKTVNCWTTRDTIEETLPSSLTELTFGMPTYPSPNDAPWTLPSQLVTLSLYMWRVEWLEALPHRLTLLSIFKLEGLSEVLKTRPFDFFGPLPTSLTHLTLLADAYAHSGKVKNEVLTHPLASLTHLRELKCTTAQLLSSTVFRYIPKSLRKLEISLSRDDPNDAPFLPSWLHSRNLSGSIDWKTTSLLSFWPKHAALPTDKNAS